MLLLLQWVAASAQSGGVILIVDPENGTSSGPGTLAQPFDSLRAAVAFANQSVLTTIQIIGREVNGTILLHDNTRESFFSAGPIVIRPNLKVRWNQSLSDTIPPAYGIAGKVPPIFTGAGTSGDPTLYTAFSIQATTVDVTTTNVLLEKLWLVAFDVGVDIPANQSPRTVSPKLDGLTFNQCARGIQVNATNLTTHPVIQNGSFLNEVQTLGGGAPVAVSATEHIYIPGSTGGLCNGTITSCKFRSGNPPGFPVPYNVGAGIRIDAIQGANVSPVISNCTFRGNSDIATPTDLGMLFGLEVTCISARSDFVASDCWFGTCGADGIQINASSNAALTPGEDADSDPDPDSFISPSITRCTLWKNGNLGVGVVDSGHGIATRCYLNGALRPVIKDCTRGSPNGAYPVLGISENTIAGVYIHSEFSDDPTAVPPDWGMRHTFNSTIVEQSEIFNNGLSGVQANLDRGSGRPWANQNRIFHNGTYGVWTRAEGHDLDPTLTDKVYALPVTSNNFIYNLDANSDNIPDLPDQNVGVFTEVRAPDPLNKVVAPVGVHFNTITFQTQYAFDVDSSDNIQAGYALGNVFYYTANGGVPPDVALDTQGFVQYSCADQLPLGVSGNIVAIPGLVAYKTGDLHLASVASPCVDMALEYFPNYDPDNDADIDGDMQRPVDKISGPTNLDSDMGADEIQ